MIPFNIRDFPKFMSVCGWRNFTEVMKEQGHPSAKLMLDRTRWQYMRKGNYPPNERRRIPFICNIMELK